jgi:superfamily I DNA and/or RNA helicase
MILLHPEITGLIAIGDPQQLPSVVMNKTLERKGLGRSLFQRLIEGKSPYHMLSAQYRMCPSISQWPSEYFYGGKITNGPNVILPSRAPAWQMKGNALLCPYTYINVTGSEHRNDKTQSFSNQVECDVAYELVKELMRQATRISFSGPIEVGCVTGYTEQVKSLKDRLCTLEGAIPVETGSRIERVLVKIAPLCQIGLDIASVDAFQGQERDIIIFCTTRANVGGGIGFLSMCIKYG